MNPMARNGHQRNILRYAFGATVGLLLAITFGGLMGYLLPLLALPFLAGNKALGLAEGLMFMVVMALAVLFVNVVILFFVDYPAVLILVLFLLIFHIFYARHKLLPPPVKILLMACLLSIPNLATKSVALAQGISLGMVVMASASVLLTWLCYYVFPADGVPAPAKASLPPVRTTGYRKKEYREALTKTIVIFPAVLLFYFVELTSALLVLIYISILTFQKGFGKGFDEGKLLVLGNLIGGVLAIVFYELVALVPTLPFYFLLMLLVGIFIASRLFGPSPLAPIYGTAFTTFLLVIGITTSFGSTDAGTKVWVRVSQIMMAVIYVAVFFGFIYEWRKEYGKA
ncbi:DUF2955 domain-containing protein [Maribacter sp. 2307ULW6-5]|uniref:DUF2955 domain-containing protein n=1 Tax=Maribacter sp. 2307ULW6-5 TaxID=3386275 RepID=UPI0039BC740B